MASLLRAALSEISEDSSSDDPISLAYMASRAVKRAKEEGSCLVPT